MKIKKQFKLDNICGELMSELRVRIAFEEKKFKKSIDEEFLSNY